MALSFPGSGLVLNDVDLTEKSGNPLPYDNGEMKYLERDRKTIKDVLDKYEMYLNRKIYPEYVMETFRQERDNIDDLLNNGDIDEAVEETITLYEFLSDHGAVDPRVRYPGPTERFKLLVEKLNRK